MGKDPPEYVRSSGEEQFFCINIYIIFLSPLLNKTEVRAFFSLTPLLWGPQCLAYTVQLISLGNKLHSDISYKLPLSHQPSVFCLYTVYSSRNARNVRNAELWKWRFRRYVYYTITIDYFIPKTSPLGTLPVTILTEILPPSQICTGFCPNVLLMPFTGLLPIAQNKNFSSLTSTKFNSSPTMNCGTIRNL